MAEARLTRIIPDATLARSFLIRAQEFSADGARDRNSHASRQVLLHNAAIAACDAVLAINGFEVEGSEGGHRLRLEKAEQLLGDDHRSLFEELDDARLARGTVSYAAGFALEADVEVALMAVRALVEHVELYIGAREAR